MAPQHPGNEAPPSGASAEGTQAEELLRLTLEAVPAGMLMVDRRGRIALANSRIERLFGYGHGELAGAAMEMLLAPRFRAGHRRHRSDFLAHPLAGAQDAGRPVFALRKDGAEFPVEVGVKLAASAAGRFALVSIVDITRRLALEKKLADSERLADIGGMISVVAHEIRNPLSTIVMAAKAVAHQDLSREEHDQVLSLLTLETERLNRTLTDILHFAKPCEPKLARGDLNGAAREVLGALKADPRNAGRAEVREALDENLPEIFFDADQMRQVLWNIVGNAFQALDGAAAGVVEVRTEVRPGEVALHVQDDGPGISPDQLEKIFQPFFTTKSQGTGLGLPTSRRIVRAHGGDIRVESAPGRGARFSIMLPVPGKRGG